MEQVLKDMIAQIRAEYPNVRHYVKNGYHYIEASTFPGYTLGSGDTSDEAWFMAHQAWKERKEDLGL